MTRWRAAEGSEIGVRSPRLLGIVGICAVVLALVGCTALIPHAVSTPASPSVRSPTDSTTGEVGRLMFFGTGGAACSNGHSVQHQWDWGDGTYSEWLYIERWYNTWDSPGTFEVKVRARCAQAPTVVSAWSKPLTVTIPPPPPPSPPSPSRKLAAEFEIIGWEQSHYPSLGKYSAVRISYRITNTGDYDIAYYKVWFEVRCADGTMFRDWTNGLDVKVGKYATSVTYVDTAGKGATAVSVSDYELER